ncbi:MAG TPA: STAS domain-containing protein [Desulfuromonadales bacterium]|nr:STAS domain-containing protein [Desulfuromonadales bacterium]
MKDQVSSATTESTFHVPPDATVRNAADFRNSLLEAVREAPSLTLDLSCVESVDLSFFQIVLAGRRMAAEMQKTFILNQQSASEPIRDAFALCGYSFDHGGSLADESVGLWKEEE